MVNNTRETSKRDRSCRRDTRERVLPPHRTLIIQGYLLPSSAYNPFSPKSTFSRPARPTNWFSITAADSNNVSFLYYRKVAKKGPSTAKRQNERRESRAIKVKIISHALSPLMVFCMLCWPLLPPFGEFSLYDLTSQLKISDYRCHVCGFDDSLL